jgi:hypothetical protein
MQLKFKNKWNVMFFKAKEKPMVLAYIGDNDPTRGDSRGFKGIAERVAEKLDGKPLYLDHQTLSALVPDPKKDTDQKLITYLNKVGYPKIIFSNGSYNVMGQLKKKGLKLSFTSINESLSEAFTNVGLVSHHLRKKKLIEEGKKLREKFPFVLKPLIGVMVADHANNYELFTKQLLKAAKDYDEASVYVCTGRRTDKDSYLGFIKHLRKALKEAGKTGIRVHGFHLPSSRSNPSVESENFNPYVGILNEADHLIIYGGSHSLVSEALATGKSVHLFDSPMGAPEHLKRKDILHDFRLAAEFKTREIEPIDVTDKIATSIAKEFKSCALWRSARRLYRRCVYSVGSGATGCLPDYL